MYYVLKLFINSNMLIEGVYSTKIKAENKANYYMINHRDRIRFYDIDVVGLYSQSVNEDMLETLYS